MKYNIYCDESCHLEHDGINVMVLGSVWCPKEKLKDINKRLKAIKTRNNSSLSMEMKWTKISPGKLNQYVDVVNYYFDNDDIHFRAVVIPDKTKLRHQSFGQTHDDWYYKMYFDMLKVIFSPKDTYEVYVDIKDSNSNRKIKKLKEVCCNSIYDFSQKIIQRFQPVRSEEIEIMQLVDILIGAVGYENRKFPENFQKSSAKQNLVELIKKRSGYTLKKTTLLREEKFNLLSWDARVI